ncbi:MAG TPA: DUF4340 domain-containing protein [Thermoanaerobaculia bacterium]
MSPKKLIALTAVVAVLFAFIALFERKMPTTAERERKGDLYWDIPSDRVDRLSLTRGGDKLEFQRVDPTHWKMTVPQRYPAESFVVSSLVSDLAAMKRSGEEVADAKPADFGLDKPVATATFEWTEADDPKARKTRTIEFGAEVPGTDVVSARLAHTEKVLFVPSSVLTSVKKNSDEFLSKDVFGVAGSDMNRLEILRGRGRLVLVRKNGTWWLAEPFSDLADAQEADRLAGQIAALRAREFVRGGADLPAQGLNPSLFHVAVTDAKGGTVAVDFGATRADGNAVYAQRDGQVLTVDREIVDDLSKEAVAFRSSRLADFNRTEVTGLDGVFGKTTFALAQKDGGWTSGGHAVLAPSVDDVESAILDAQSKGFLDEAEAKTLGTPDATITVKTKTHGESWVLALHSRPGGAAATVSGRPGAFSVDPGLAGQLEEAFRKAVSPPPTPSPAKATPAKNKG